VVADLKLLQAGVSELGIGLTREQLSAFSIYMDELMKWNQRANLTAIATPDGIQTRHFLDSLTCLLGFPVEQPTTVNSMAPLSDVAERLNGGEGLSCLDVGTGAGFPGIPLKIFLPRMKLTLLESIAKKTAFLTNLVDLLGPEDTTVITGRAEELARQPDHRERYDVVVTRAVSKLAVVAELTLPFCRIGARSIALKKGEHMAQEIEESRYAVRQLGGQYAEEVAVKLSLLDEGRMVIVLEKVSSTHAAYPRRPGMPAKRPLLAPGSTKQDVQDRLGYTSHSPKVDAEQRCQGGGYQQDGQHDQGNRGCPGDGVAEPAVGVLAHDAAIAGYAYGEHQHHR